MADTAEERHRWLATLARGFLQREKVLIRVEIPENLPADQETLLRERLKTELSDELISHWELDPGTFSPYKAPDPSLKETDAEGYAEGVSASSILLSNGDPASKAIPVSEVSGIFRHLAREHFRLRRLYCDPAIEKRVKAIAAGIVNP